MDIGTLHPSPHYVIIKYAVRDSKSVHSRLIFSRLVILRMKNPSRARD